MYSPERSQFQTVHYVSLGLWAYGQCYHVNRLAIAVSWARQACHASVIFFPGNHARYKPKSKTVATTLVNATGLCVAERDSSRRSHDRCFLRPRRSLCTHIGTFSFLYSVLSTSIAFDVQHKGNSITSVRTPNGK